MSNLIGIKVAIALREPLYHIKHWCEGLILPPLTIIVVHQETGKPCNGLALDDNDIDKAREVVFTYAW